MIPTLKSRNVVLKNGYLSLHSVEMAPYIAMRVRIRDSNNVVHEVFDLIVSSGKLVHTGSPVSEPLEFVGGIRN